MSNAGPGSVAGVPVSGVAVVIAESRGLLRAGLAGLLASWPHGAVLQADTLEGAVSALMPGAACVMLLDFDLLGAAGAAGLRVVRRTVPGARILVLGGRNDRDVILACLAAGAQGFVSRRAEFAALQRAIEVVRGGGTHVPDGIAERAAPGPGPVAPCLTGRQQEVLRLLAEGRSTKDIARTLDLAVSTIKVHLAALYRTVGARNRVEALCRAGLLPPLGAQGPVRRGFAQAA